MRKCDNLTIRQWEDETIFEASFPIFKLFLFTTKNFRKLNLIQKTGHDPFHHF